MRALLDNAMQGARRGAALTQRMLAFARRQELKREAVDLPALFSRMQDFLQSAVGPLIDVTTDVPRHLPPVCTDATQLESALQNLALNARDAMPGGGMITITAREMRVESGREGNLASGDYICIAVRDVGHGMDEATLARATEPFFTTKGIGKGTGLGLSMVDGLVAQSGGRLVVRSELGRGTTVELWLPVADDELRASPDQVASTDATLPETATRLVVLAVDDDSLVLMNIAAMLEDLGHRVIDVGSAAAALDIIDSDRHVDLVISDQAMPGMTGVELFDAIRARRPQLRLVLATGYAELPVGSNVPVRRLAKPFTQRELAEVVADAMR
jgi:CheY-like chemotaxis protein